jgi:transcriptional/translational regulatory protein YebC/TACO1
MLLKETYAEFFQETRFDGILFAIENSILDHNWRFAKEAIAEARAMRVPEGMIQEAITKAFRKHHDKFRDLQTEMIHA